MVTSENALRPLLLFQGFRDAVSDLEILISGHPDIADRNDSERNTVMSKASFFAELITQIHTRTAAFGAALRWFDFQKHFGKGPCEASGSCARKLTFVNRVRVFSAFADHLF